MSNTAPSASDFTTTYPQFSGIAYAGQVALCLAMSTKLLAKEVWGEFYSEGVMLDAAHNVFLATQAAAQGGMGAMQMAVGTISSVSAAGVSTSFNSSSSNKSQTDEWYSKTVYGQQFLRLRNLIAPLGVLTA